MAASKDWQAGAALAREIVRRGAKRRHRTIGSLAFSRRWPRSAFMPSPRSMPTIGGRGARAASEARWRARLGRSDFRRPNRTRPRCDVAGRRVHGLWVSAHPDVILKMGVKEVLHRTKHLGWGTDTHLYRDRRVRFDEEFPPRLQSAGPRVLKQNRGNGGQGVWKVELVLQRRGTRRPSYACCRRAGAACPKRCRSTDFMRRCEAYFADGGCIVDQPFQPRLPDGMIRCYMGADKVVGFGHQFIKALIPPPPEGPDSQAAQPGPRIMHSASAPRVSGAEDKDGNRSGCRR